MQPSSVCLELAPRVGLRICLWFAAVGVGTIWGDDILNRFQKMLNEM